MAKTVVTPQGYGKPAAPYSLATKSGNLVFVSGMVSINEKGELVGAGDIRAQTRQVLNNIRAAVVAAGGGLPDVTKTTIYLPDLADYAGMNEVYREFFAAEPPARATVQAGLIKPEFLIEIEAIAVVGGAAPVRRTTARHAPRNSKKAGSKKRK